jgi:phosphopantothenoylcysteine decarboxylase/phosphopantothenate--cysteine ligase
MGKVLLVVTGSIAAYKAISLMRKLQYGGHTVQVLMTESAKGFVGEMTFAALADYPMNKEGEYPHLDISRECDVAVIAPATANIISKMATGLADDVVSATLLGYDGPKIVAPAMNVRMLNNPATQRNLHTLEQDGVTLVMPGAGLLACGDEGAGKLAKLDDICAVINSLIS